MATSVKISQLGNIGNNISGNSLMPIVDVTGVSTTDKVNVANLGNFILGQAGNTLNAAFLSSLAYSVANAAQPNITSVGNLTSLTVVGATDLGAVGNVTIIGGLVGQVLSTDGAGNLSWVDQSGNGGNGSVGGANTQIQFNDAGSFGGNTGFTFNKTTGIFTAPFLAGNGNGLSNIQGANVSGAVSSATTAGTVTTNAQPNITSVGTLTSLAVTGNANVGNVNLSGNIIGSSTIEIDNRTSGNSADINLYSADDILIQARDRDTGSTAEGGDINIFAGDSAVDSDTSAGDIVIEAGAGGASNIDFGGSGGFIRVEAGRGGAASTDANGFSALSGGQLTLRAGDGGINNGNIFRGATGGDVSIEAGDSTGNGDPGGSIILTAGTAGANALAGQIQLIIPSSDEGNGGTWTFNGEGIIQLPNSGTIGNDGNNIDIGSTSAISLEASTVVNIYTDTGTAAYQWQFGDDGSTIFPTLTVDIHNGGNETAQTLQFGDATQQAIITGPTPDADTNAQRLIIQGQRGNGTGEGGDVYVWAGDADTNGGDIKIYAGDADNVSAGSGGYINLAGGDGFDYGGGITLNGGISANGYGGQVSMTGGSGELEGGYASLQGGFSPNGQGGDVQIAGGGSSNGQGSYGNIEIGSGTYSWLFDNTGNLRLPSGGIVYETSIPGGVLTGNTIVLKPQGGTNADQQLLVYPTAIGADFNHLHLTSGNLYNTELFLGNDDFYVKLANTGNVIINSNDGTGNTAQWTFDTDGNLTVPGNTTVSTTNATGGAAGNSISIVAGAADQSDYYTTAGGNVNITGGLGAGNDGGGGGVGGSVNINAGLSADPAGNAGNVVINTGTTKYTFNESALNVTQNPPASPAPTLSGFGLIITPELNNGTGNVTINANSSIWTFDSTGNLTVPSWIDGQITTFDGAIAGNVLTVTNAVDGTIARGQTIYGNTVLGNTVIVLQLTESSANAGGNGTYRVTNTQTVSAEAMYVNSLYLDGDLKLAADHGVYVRDANDPYQYDNLIGIAEVDATILIGSLNTNGVTLDNNKEYKVDSALNPGTYMAVAKVNAADEVILSSGNSANTLIRVGGDSATTGYAMKFNNGGEGLIPTGLRIGDNTNATIFNAPLEISSILGAEANNQSRPSGIGMPTYRGTGTVIANDEWGSYLYGSRYRGTINTPLPVKDGDWLMEFGATAFDGTNNNGGGEIAFRVDGSVTGSSNPSKIEFYNTLTGANNQSLGMVLDASQKLSVTGNIQAPQLISNVATGTAPLTVTSTTRVANLNVAYANVADYINVTAPGTGTGYVIFANATTGNIAEYTSSGITSNLANNAISATTFVGNLVGAFANGNSNVSIATANGNVTISAVGNTTMTVTGTGANITGTLNVTGNITGNTNGFAIGYLNIPQVAAANTTLALTDAGKHYYSTSAGNFTLTIPNNTSVSFATGTAISIVVQSAGNVLVNAVSGVTLYMAGNSTAANRVVSNYGMATLMKVATDTWFINGTGVA